MEPRDAGVADARRLLCLRSRAASIAWIVVVNVTTRCALACTVAVAASLLLPAAVDAEAFGVSACDAGERDHRINIKNFENK